MNSSDLKELKGILERANELFDNQEDLIDNAICCVDHGSEYRAEDSLRTMLRNYRKVGHDAAAHQVEKYL